MIQEIAPRKYHCEYRTDLAPEPDSALIVCTEKGLLFRTAGADAYVLPRFADFCGGGNAMPGFAADARYLFSIDAGRFFLVSPDRLPADLLKNGYVWQPFTFLRTYEPQYLAFAAATAVQIWRFYRANRFCGRCGSPMKHSETERAMVCPSCGFIRFPQIAPAIIVAVRDGDRLVLTQNKRSVYPYRALIAGFMEIGETPEDTVHREVFEETGLQVKNLKLYNMQPWAFSDTLMIGYVADLDGPDKITVQRSELTDASWFDRKDVTSAPFAISIGHEMIMAFREGRI